MNDLVTLCLLGVFLIVGFMLLSRMMRSGGYGERGSEPPRYDDPNVRSGGSFGGDPRPGGDTRPSYDSPNVSSRGFFGRSRPAASNRPPSSGGRADSPNVRSRGGFGRSKK
jgi:hypothetical protein